MFTLTPEQLAYLAGEPEGFGSIIMRLVLPMGELETIDFQPCNGWTAAEVSEAARERYGDLEMRSYVDPTRSIALTVAQGDNIHFYAEGEGWAIESDHQYSGWERGGFFANTFSPTNHKFTAGEAMISLDLETTGFPGSDSNQLHAVGIAYQQSQSETASEDAFRTWITMPQTSPIDRDILAQAFGEIDDRSIPPIYDKASWLAADHDWDSFIQANPTWSLARIHMLASGLGIAWALVEDEQKPLTAMIAAIERALGIPDDENPPQLGTRIERAEQAVTTKEPNQ